MYTYLEIMSSKGSLMQGVLCFLTMYLSVTVWSRRNKKLRTLKLLEKFPGPKKYGILGTLESYFIALNPPKNMMPSLRKLAKEHGPIYTFWDLDHPYVVLADPEVAIKLFTEDSLQNKSTPVVAGAKAAGGEGLLAVQADVHPIRRKQWMPSFTRKQVENSIKFFRQQALRLCDDIAKFQKTGQVFDLLDLSVECTFRAICQTAFGEEYMTQLSESMTKEYLHDVHTVSLKLTARAFTPWLSNDFVYFYGTRDGRETMKSIKRGNLLTKNALHERNRHLQKSILAGENNGEPRSSEDFECFVDNMLALMNAGELTEKEVIQELNVFIIAGYDTSGITISFVLYLLAINPEHQDRIVEELCEVIPSEYWGAMDAYPMTAVSTKKMKYLELCIKETLRLYPVLPVSPRGTTHDVQLPGGLIIPDGTDVFVLLDMILRDPKYFPEPNKFLPERHLKPNPAFMPFTLGSRNCLGQVYAMYEMKVILVYLLMAYKWETTESPEGIQTLFQTLQVPENGLHFKITRREF